METEFLTVKNNLIVNTKFGKRRVINFTNGEATWINDTAAMWHINNKQKVEVIRDPEKDTLTIVERSVMPETPVTKERKEVEAKGMKPVKETMANSVGEMVEDLLDEDDLPVFSDADKIKIARYIKSQAKILKHCHETIIDSFPEIAITDPRGARSLAVTLLISANQAINRR